MPCGVGRGIGRGALWSGELGVGLWELSKLLERERAADDGVLHRESRKGRRTLIMAAYIVVQVDVKDPARYADYRTMVPPTLAKYGGRFIVRGGRTETLEGDWSPKRFVVVEF